MEISKLFGKPKTYTIAGGEFKFYPLELEDIDIIMNMEKSENRGEGIKKLILETFKKSYPETKPEEVLKISIEHFEELTKAILDVNNVEVPNDTTQ